jgi:hypothetical protein
MSCHLIIIAHVTEVIIALVLTLGLCFRSKILRLGETLAVLCKGMWSICFAECRLPRTVALEASSTFLINYPKWSINKAIFSHSSSMRASGYERSKVGRPAPLTLLLYSSGSLISSAAASPLSGSVGLGYRSSCGRKTSNTLIKSAVGDREREIQRKTLMLREG